MQLGKRCRNALTFVLCSKRQVGSQGVIDKVMRLAMYGDNILEFWDLNVSIRSSVIFVGAGLHTVPELLLII